MGGEWGEAGQGGWARGPAACLGRTRASAPPLSALPGPTPHQPLLFQDRQRVEAALHWMGAHPWRGAAAFAALEAAAVVALVPASLFALAAGALFGPATGAAVAWTGLAVGQTAAFCVGRTLLRARVAAWLAAAPPRWAAVDAALAAGGWRLAALLRLSPAVPWNVLNYALSATGLALGPYAAASAAATAPWCALFAYLGSVARSLADVLDGSAGPSGTAGAAMLAAGGALLVAAVLYVSTLAKCGTGPWKRGFRGATWKQGGETGGWRPVGGPQHPPTPVYPPLIPSAGAQWPTRCGPTPSPPPHWRPSWTQWTPWTGRKRGRGGSGRWEWQCCRRAGVARRDERGAA